MDFPRELEWELGLSCGYNVAFECGNGELYVNGFPAS